MAAHDPDDDPTSRSDPPCNRRVFAKGRGKGSTFFSTPPHVLQSARSTVGPRHGPSLNQRLQQSFPRPSRSGRRVKGLPLPLLSDRTTTDPYEDGGRDPRLGSRVRVTVLSLSRLTVHLRSPERGPGSPERRRGGSRCRPRDVRTPTLSTPTHGLDSRLPHPSLKPLERIGTVRRDPFSLPPPKTHSRP